MFTVKYTIGKYDHQIIGLSLLYIGIPITLNGYFASPYMKQNFSCGSSSTLELDAGNLAPFQAAKEFSTVFYKLTLFEDWKFLPKFNSDRSLSKLEFNWISAIHHRWLHMKCPSASAYHILRFPQKTTTIRKIGRGNKTPLRLNLQLKQCICQSTILFATKMSSCPYHLDLINANEGYRFLWFGVMPI